MYFVLVHCNDHYLGIQRLSWRLAWASFAWALTTYSQVMTWDQERNVYSGVLCARKSWAQYHSNVAAQHLVCSYCSCSWKTLGRHASHLWMILHIVSYLILNIITFLVEYWKLVVTGNFCALFIFLALHHIEIKLAYILHNKCHIKFSC